MEIDGHCCAHSVVRIEIEKVQGQYASWVRIKIKGADDALTFACFGATQQQPEVTIIEKDEREPADAFDQHSEESDR